MDATSQILASSGTDAAALGSRFGLSAEQTQSAMASLLPAILGGLQHRPDAAAAGQTIDHTDPAAGNDVLGQIFGTKDVSREVADHASGQTGVSSTVLKAMLPIVAAMVARHFATATAGGGGGGLGGLLGSLLQQGAGNQGGGQAGLPGGLGGLAGMFGSGNPLDAILGRNR
ncbi:MULTISPECIES: DUF937 domain-containing protein [unclassified Sphingomonas]|uniref:DUF937 domain-containing protein n=1 Tax=unclassified Sphingomonas TaxID=196159 RepID=UPI00226A812C|nr:MULTISPECIES: DUF937 domain-containing protein [unclassified Sphingomonas]